MQQNSQLFSFQDRGVCPVDGVCGTSLRMRGNVI